MVTKRNSLSDTRRESFYTELHALLTAGLDFSQAFRLLIDGERDARIKALLKQLYGNVVDGAALWQAMERSEAFRRLECGVIRIGDETGRLAETLEFLGDYFRKRSVQRANDLFVGKLSARYPLYGRGGRGFHARGRCSHVRRSLCPHGRRTAGIDSLDHLRIAGISRLCRRDDRGILWNRYNLLCKPKQEGGTPMVIEHVVAPACGGHHYP